MVEKQRSIPVRQVQQQEGIDFGKLGIVFRSNWILLLILFAAVNIAAYLVVRYTKNVYQSMSVLKLDFKEEATEFGIKAAMVEDQSYTLIAGEIEIIQSRLFLTRVLDAAKLDISYFSAGRVLDDELYQSQPFRVQYRIHRGNLLNTRINFRETNELEYRLEIGETRTGINGHYDQWVKLDGIDVLITRNTNFLKGDEVGYYFTINSKDALLSYLLNNLTAEPLNYNANTIQISFKDHNPFKATAILNTIDTTYLQYSNEQKNLATYRKIEWITRELAAIENKMQDYETYFENFTLQNKTNNLDADLQKAIEAIARLDSQRYQINQRIADIDQSRTALGRGDYYTSVSQRRSMPPALSASFEELEKLQRDQERLKLSYNEITFAYREKERAIESLHQKIDRELSRLREDFAQQLNRLTQSKSRLEHEFANLPDKSTQFSKNQRYYKLYEQFYLSLMQSKSEFEITQAGTIQDFKILSPATLPVRPLSPNKLMISGIGLVASAMLVLFLLGVLYMLNNKLTAVSEIENAVSVPVLGVVPASHNLGQNSLYVIDHPRSMVSEAIRTLRTNLDFFNAGASRKVIAISSTVSGEGKSFIAMNLGGVIAMSGKRVVLVDLDMRKPKVVLSGKPIDNTRGVSTILINRNAVEECIGGTSVENFDILPAGPHPPNPSELLMNPSFGAMLETLKRRYDFIILDTPPVGLVTDGIMAMKQADITIYIFRANYSKKDFLFNLQRIININKFSNITTLLNALPNQGEQSYGYGYYEEPRNGHWAKKIFNR